MWGHILHSYPFPLLPSLPFPPLLFTPLPSPFLPTLPILPPYPTLFPSPTRLTGFGGKTAGRSSEITDARRPVLAHFGCKNQDPVTSRFMRTKLKTFQFSTISRV
jgi:hypothetical protein